MVNKNYKTKLNRIQTGKILFMVVMLIYFSGLCSGCIFALKNAENKAFVSLITGTEKLLAGENTGFFSAYISMYTRDIIIFIFILVFKYSGVLKGLSICPVFVYALQNSCIYSVYYSNINSVLNMIFKFALKDTAVSFLLTIFCYITLKDIADNRYNHKKDIKKITVYLVGITAIYSIDFILKLIFV